MEGISRAETNEINCGCFCFRKDLKFVSIEKEMEALVENRE